LIHAPFGGPERGAQWRALVQLQQAGKARSIGVSNFNQAHLEEIKAAGLPMPDANQIELHPWSQKTELLSYMKQNDITPIAYSSLVPLLSWRAEEGQKSARTSAMTEDGRIFTDMAAKYGVTAAQFLLRWGIQNGYPILPKSINPERIRQNIKLAGFIIEEDDMELIRTMDHGVGVAWIAGDPIEAK